MITRDGVRGGVRESRGFHGVHATPRFGLVKSPQVAVWEAVVTGTVAGRAKLWLRAEAGPNEVTDDECRTRESSTRAEVLFSRLARGVGPRCPVPRPPRELRHHLALVSEFLSARTGAGGPAPRANSRSPIAHSQERWRRNIPSRAVEAGAVEGGDPLVLPDRIRPPVARTAGPP
jgi:hypothetical protein